MIRHALRCTLLACALLFITGAASPALRAEPPRFVTVEGGQFVYDGQPVRLKGVTFYPRRQPWASLWPRWDGPATRADLAPLPGLGANVIRVMIPFRLDHEVTDADGRVRPEVLVRLREMVQLAGEQRLKVLFTLFDFYDDTPAADDPRWATNVAYMESLAGAFANDDRVLGWDIHNEPDLYTSWTRRPQEAIGWLLRVGDELHRLAPQQLVTVGVAQADALWQPGPAGRTLLDVVDFASFHSYDAGRVAWDITNLRAHTNKPLVLEETGWPTGPCGLDPNFNESHQVVLYTAMLAAAEAGNLNGFLAWTLWDFPPTSSSGGGVESENDHFGLLRLDGSEKPAAALYRGGFSAGSGPLASSMGSSLALSVAPPPEPRPPPPDWIPPIYFPATGHDIRDEFRDYWRRFGGLPIFGYPLTQPWREGGRLVQYFERARFEFKPENRKLPGFDRLTPGDQLRLVVQLTQLGRPMAEARTFPPAAPPAADPAVTWFPETQHSLRGTFRRFWQDNAGLTNFGYPLSEEVREVSPLDGQTYTVQYFERARFEYHPQQAGTPYEVLLGQLGTELLAARGCR